MFLCRPRTQSARRALIYSTETLPELFKIIELQKSEVREATIGSDQTLTINIIGNNQRGTVVPTNDTYTIKTDNVVVFGDGALEVLTQDEFDKKYERIGERDPDKPEPSVQPEDEPAVPPRKVTEDGE